jgi:hypothetical protein
MKQDLFNEQPDPGAAAKRPDIRLPDDYTDEHTFLTDVIREMNDDINYDRLNREAALEDLRFIVGDQWDDIVRQQREAARKPTLTINRLPAFIAQVVGNRRINETTIRVIPDNDEQQAAAQIREGLIRNIQKTSRAELAYDRAMEGAVGCGIGNFQIELDWNPVDVFVQDIKISAINDHLSVLWDRMRTDPTGSDARHVAVIDTFSKRDFYKRWPWATPGDVIQDAALRGDLRMNGWIAQDDIRVCSYWRMRTRPRTMALMMDGTTQDITDELKEPGEALQVLAKVKQKPDGSPYIRDVQRPFAEMYILSAANLLEGPYQLDISRVPVFRVPGWEMNVGSSVHRWGITRFLKDPQRYHNFWRSVVAERIMQTPRQVWIAGASVVQGREAAFRNAHLSDDPLLVYNDDSGGKPERVAPAQIENSLMAQAETSTQDIKDVSNIHEANLGMPSNEVSGAAIMARQRVSDTGTVIYHDNLNMALEQCGVTLNELVSTVYDTARTIKVLGQKQQQKLVKINDPDDPDAIDITFGKYSVSIITGPSYATKRMEALASMTALANAAPQSLALFMDLYVQAQDWPMADEIAARIRATMPPGTVPLDDLSPEEQQQQQGKAQGAQAQQQQADAMANAQYQKLQSETAVNAARAQSFMAQAQSTPAKDNLAAQNVASQMTDREIRTHLETMKTVQGT